MHIGLFYVIAKIPHPRNLLPQQLKHFSLSLHACLQLSNGILLVMDNTSQLIAFFFGTVHLSLQLFLLVFQILVFLHQAVHMNLLWSNIILDYSFSNAIALLFVKIPASVLECASSSHEMPAYLLCPKPSFASRVLVLAILLSASFGPKFAKLFHVGV